MNASNWSDSDWDRAAKIIENRIAHLDITQDKISRRGGPSPAKVREIVNRRSTTLSPSKRRDLARALEWTETSIDDVLNGGDPTPAPPELLAEWRRTWSPSTAISAGEIPYGKELMSASRQIVRSLALLNDEKDLREEAADALTGVAATVSLVAHNIRNELKTEGAPHDESQQPEAEGGATQAAESEKIGAGDPRDPDDYDLAGRDTGDISEGEAVRRQQERTAEQGGA